MRRTPTQEVLAGPPAQQEAQRRGRNGIEELWLRFRKASRARAPDSPCRASAGARTARPTKNPWKRAKMKSSQVIAVFFVFT